MGWQDRDYANTSNAHSRVVPAFGGFRKTKSVVTILIWVNIAIYVICTLGANRQFGILNSGLFQAFVMNTELVLKGQFWRIVTSDYLHWNVMHIFMNMLGLYFLGRPLEQLWGGKKFFVVYSVAGILGSLFYMLLTIAGVLESGLAAGASGCVLGLLGAAAVLFPHAEVYVYFLFPVKIRVVAGVLAAYYIFNVFRSGSNAGGDACHLAGLAFGTWWAMRGEQWWSGRRRQSRAVPAAHGRAAPFRRHINDRKRDAVLVDAILAKVHQRGITALSETEKRALAEATARQQADEREFDRVDRL